MKHTHTWQTVWEDGELEQQECACGASRDLRYDFQDGSVNVEVYPSQER